MPDDDDTTPKNLRVGEAKMGSWGSRGVTPRWFWNMAMPDDDDMDPNNLRVFGGRDGLSGVSKRDPSVVFGHGDA